MLYEDDDELNDPKKATIFSAFLFAALLLIPVTFFWTYPGFEEKKSELADKCLSEYRDYIASDGREGSIIEVPGFTPIRACYEQAALDADPPWFEWILLIGFVMGLWYMFILPTVDGMFWGEHSIPKVSKAEKKFKEELQDKPGKYVKLGKDNWDFSVVLSNAKRNLKPNGTYSLRTTGFYNMDDINAGLRAAKIYIKSYKFNKSAKRTEQIVQILEKIIENTKKSPNVNKPNFSRSIDTSKELIKKLKELK